MVPSCNLVSYMSNEECRLQQEEVTAERRAKRAEAFVAPAESAAPTVEEKRRRKREKEAQDDGAGEGEDGAKRKKKKRKTVEADGDA